MVKPRAHTGAKIVSVATDPGRGTGGPRGVARYMELVAKFPLRPLRSERDLDRATKIVNALAVRGDLSRGEQDYLDVLTELVEAYERVHHPIPDLSGPDMLRHLLEERSVSHAEAAREMGMAPSTVSEILRGKRGIGRKHMEAFARYFHVSQAVFLAEPGTDKA
jgi:HTH-type transcriptional regulator/antitoxin HigA